LRDRRWPGARLADIDAAVRSVGDAERRASRTLGVPVDELAVIAWRLWGHGLAAERDEQVERALPAGVLARTVQAMRGHVTRQLLDELRAAIPEESVD
jgi:hypothetical protein